MNVSYSPFFWPTSSKHSSSWPFQTCLGRTLIISLENLINATKESGIFISADQANGNAYGGYFCPHNLDPVNIVRSSAREAYYNTAVARPNFHIVTGQQVTRIITEKASGIIQVTGVEVSTLTFYVLPQADAALQFASSSNATRQTVNISKEAILAAGALHTPQLLQISGIGDAAHLKSINVEPVVDLPAVGQNLHDHVSTVVVNTRESRKLLLVKSMELTRKI